MCSFYLQLNLVAPPLFILYNVSIRRRRHRAYKGSFNIRISPELHKKLAVCAISERMSLNSYIEKALEKVVLPTK